MSSATTGELALANELRNLGTAAHDASRIADGLKVREWEKWDELTVDHKAGWIAVARHVLGNYTFKHSDPEALVKVAASEILKGTGMFTPAEDCERIARDVLAAVGLIAAPVEAAR